MTYSPGLVVHIAAGILGVLSGLMALVVRKGGRLHRASGDVFVVSMLAMAGFGAYLSLLRSQPLNVVAGVFTFYLVATAWLTVSRKAGQAGVAELGFLLVAVAVGAGALLLGWEAAHRAAAGSGESAAPYFVFGSVSWLAVLGDLRLLLRGGVSGAARLVRHLWRMGTALFIAAASFFVSTASDPVLRRNGLRARLFPEAIRRTHLPEVPLLVIVVLTLFWLFRVLLARRYRTRQEDPSPARQGVMAVGNEVGA